MIKKVLVVEDSPEIGVILTQMLERMGKDVITVRDGAIAIAKLEKGRFNLVIADLLMPGTDGIEVLKAAKRLYPQMPVIIMTSRSNDEMANEAMELGVLNILTKPFSLKELEISLEKAQQQSD